MIGRRLRLAAVVTVTAVGLLSVLGPGAPRPEVQTAARRLIFEAADEADAALSRLVRDLAPAVDAGRIGSARAVAGDEPPGPKLSEAAELTRAAEASAADARRALGALERARHAADPDAAALEPVVEAGELDSIAAQLDASADVADEFAAMRARAGAVVAGLGAALTALDGGDVPAARRELEEARDLHTVIADWDVGLVTLPVWLDTTDAMIGAVERIITATEHGDADAAERAADEFAALSADAATADRALQIAISEGGGAVAAVPLERLAAVLAAATDARATIAGIRDSAAP
ncbi:MAG TPA: hypothetical protein VFN76_05560 [Candidatus Limnocylindria bacterium]|nr:hypothetical protein [Candidatus Limnocylindria bacterium]